MAQHPTSPRTPMLSVFSRRAPGWTFQDHSPLEQEVLAPGTWLPPLIMRAVPREPSSLSLIASQDPHPHSQNQCPYLPPKLEIPEEDDILVLSGHH